MQLVVEDRWSVAYGHFEVGREKFFLVVANSGYSPYFSAVETDIFCGGTLQELEDALLAPSVSSHRMTDWIRGRVLFWDRIPLIQANWTIDGLYS